MNQLLLAAFAALVFATPAGASQPDAASLDAAFDIIRKGDRIGFHAVNVEETADGQRVETRIGMKISFGPITLFNYSHEAVEIWKDGALHSLKSRTDNNGRKMTLDVAREGEALVVKGEDYQGEAPLDAIPSSYWNRKIVDTKYLLNTQTGGLIEVKTRGLGRTPAPNGALADHHEINGSVALNLWYDGLRWVGADFVVRGEALSYHAVNDDKRAQLFARLDLGGAGR